LTIRASSERLSMSSKLGDKLQRPGESLITSMSADSISSMINSWSFEDVVAELVGLLLEELVPLDGRQHGAEHLRSETSA
jgi:hypothetical protein